MKHINESIIGKRGTSQGFLKSNLRPGDVVKTRNGHLMIVNGNKFDFAGGNCPMSNYDDFLMSTVAPTFNLVVVYRPKYRIRSFINLEEKMSNETPIWERKRS